MVYGYGFKRGVCYLLLDFCFFFFKQKTAYEMCGRDWSSDVCSSDLTEPDPALVEWRKSNPEHPVLRDADAKWYVREERGG